MRLDKYLSNNTTYSRSDIKKCIKAGRVNVNDITEKSTNRVINELDKITLDDNLITAFVDLYVAFNKPSGVVCATIDSEHLTVIDSIKETALERNDQTLLDAIYNDKIQIVGRLDKDTTGLVLLTSDGEWNHKITSPKSNCAKTYRVALEETISDTQIARLEDGLLLKNETKPTLPSVVEKLSDQELLITIQEGKYHQVKRMMAAVGNRVIALHRTQIGEFVLPNEWDETEYGYLTSQERDSFL